ncbi:hypothetical protein AP1H75_10260 [Apilactobacillus apinorum]|uniref:beta strand repeat-containing protein n=1 Tax=Apilactobacillus apinorum TaxID=1218495 RepID=UPI0030EAB240
MNQEFDKKNIKVTNNYKKWAYAAATTGILITGAQAVRNTESHTILAKADAASAAPTTSTTQQASDTSTGNAQSTSTDTAQATTGTTNGSSSADSQAPASFLLHVINYHNQSGDSATIKVYTNGKKTINIYKDVINADWESGGQAIRNDTLFNFIQTSWKKHLWEGNLDLPKSGDLDATKGTLSVYDLEMHQMNINYVDGAGNVYSKDSYNVLYDPTLTSGNIDISSSTTAFSKDNPNTLLDQNNTIVKTQQAPISESTVNINFSYVNTIKVKDSSGNLHDVTLNSPTKNMTAAQVQSQVLAASQKSPSFTVDSHADYKDISDLSNMTDSDKQVKNLYTKNVNVIDNNGNVHQLTVSSNDSSMSADQVKAQVNAALAANNLSVNPNTQFDAISDMTSNNAYSVDGSNATNNPYKKSIDVTDSNGNHHTVQLNSGNKTLSAADVQQQVAAALQKDGNATVNPNTKFSDVDLSNQSANSSIDGSNATNNPYKKTVNVTDSEGKTHQVTLNSENKTLSAADVQQQVAAALQKDGNAAVNPNTKFSDVDLSNQSANSDVDGSNVTNNPYKKTVDVIDSEGKSHKVTLNSENKTLSAADVQQQVAAALQKDGNAAVNPNTKFSDVDLTNANANSDINGSDTTNNKYKKTITVADANGVAHQVVLNSNDSTELTADQVKAQVNKQLANYGAAVNQYTNFSNVDLTNQSAKDNIDGSDVTNNPYNKTITVTDSDGKKHQIKLNSATKSMTAAQVEDQVNNQLPSGSKVNPNTHYQDIADLNSPDSVSVDGSDQTNNRYRKTVTVTDSDGNQYQVTLNSDTKTSLTSEEVKDQVAKALANENAHVNANTSFPSVNLNDSQQNQNVNEDANSNIDGSDVTNNPNKKTVTVIDSDGKTHKVTLNSDGKVLSASDVQKQVAAALQKDGNAVVNPHTQFSDVDLTNANANNDINGSDAANNKYKKAVTVTDTDGVAHQVVLNSDDSATLTPDKVKEEINKQLANYGVSVNPNTTFSSVDLTDKASNSVDGSDVTNNPFKKTVKVTDSNGVDHEVVLNGTSSSLTSDQVKSEVNKQLANYGVSVNPNTSFNSVDLNNKDKNDNVDGSDATNNPYKKVITVVYADGNTHEVKLNGATAQLSKDKVKEQVEKALATYGAKLNDRTNFTDVDLSDNNTVVLDGSDSTNNPYKKNVTVIDSTGKKYQVVLNGTQNTLTSDQVRDEVNKALAKYGAKVNANTKFHSVDLSNGSENDNVDGSDVTNTPVISNGDSQNTNSQNINKDSNKNSKKKNKKHSKIVESHKNNSGKSDQPSGTISTSSSQNGASSYSSVENTNGTQGNVDQNDGVADKKSSKKVKKQHAKKSDEVTTSDSKKKAKTTKKNDNNEKIRDIIVGIISAIIASVLAIFGLKRHKDNDK